MSGTSKKEELVCIPGQRLCLSDENTVSGEGTYERQGYIYSLLAGVVRISDKDKVNNLSNGIHRIYVDKMFVFQSKIIEVKTLGNQTIVPVAGDIVTARVTVINQRFAKCSIICIGDVILKRVYRGILRKEDVRAERKDEVSMYNSFRPGDIILARIVSIIKFQYLVMMTELFIINYSLFLVTTK